MNLILKLHTYLCRKSKLYKQLFYFVANQIFPGLFAKYAERKIIQDRDELNKKNVEKISWRINVEEVIEQISKEINEQNERKKIIEDKSKAVLATISISITAITFSLNYQKVAFSSSYDIALLVLLILSIFYFISATIRAIHAITIRVVYVFQAEAVTVNSEIRLKPLKKGKEKLQELLKNRLLNDLTILIQSNYATAAYTLVRNGIVLFALYFICALASKVEPSNAITTHKQQNKVRMFNAPLKSLPDSNKGVGNLHCTTKPMLQPKSRPPKPAN